MADFDWGTVGAAGVTGLSAVNNIITNLKEWDNNRKALRAINNLDQGDYDWSRTYEDLQDPEERMVYELEDTAYNNIAVDPSVLSAQREALNDLINLSEAKGLNAVDQQALQEIIDEENRTLQGQNQATLQNAMERGVYGSGLEMAQRLQNAQSSANRMNNRDMDVMSQAQQRALEALTNYGNLASNMRTQDFGEQEKIANANDIINKANWENRQNISNANVQDRNTTRAGNTEIHNKNQDANFEEANTRYGYDVEKAKMLANQYGSNNNTLKDTRESTDKWLGTLSSSFGSAMDKSK